MSRTTSKTAKFVKTPVETVRVVPAEISPKVYEALSRGEVVQGFKRANDTDYIKPATFKPERTRVGVLSQDGYSLPIYDQKVIEVGNGSTRVERGEVVGYQVKVYVTFDGNSSTQTTFFSSPEASAQYDRNNKREVEREISFFIEDPEGEVTPLVPFYGGRVSLSLFVEGLTGAEAEEKVLAALEGVFGDRETTIRNVRSKDVLDERVDVFQYTFKPGELPEVIATGILSDESGYFQKGSGSTQTRYLPIDETGRERVARVQES